MKKRFERLTGKQSRRPFELPLKTRVEFLETICRRLQLKVTLLEPLQRNYRILSEKVQSLEAMLAAKSSSAVPAAATNVVDPPTVDQPGQNENNAVNKQKKAATKRAESRRKRKNVKKKTKNKSPQVSGHATAQEESTSRTTSSAQSGASTALPPLVTQTPPVHPSLVTEPPTPSLQTATDSRWIYVSGLANHVTSNDLIGYVESKLNVSKPKCRMLLPRNENPANRRTISFKIEVPASASQSILARGFWPKGSSRVFYTDQDFTRLRQGQNRLLPAEPPLAPQQFRQLTLPQMFQSSPPTQQHLRLTPP